MHGIVLHVYGKDQIEHDHCHGNGGGVEGVGGVGGGGDMCRQYLEKKCRQHF